MDDTMVGREVWTWATERVDALPVRPRLMRYERDGGEQGEWLNLRSVSNPADCIPAVDSRPNLRVYDSERDALLDWIAVVDGERMRMLSVDEARAVMGFPAGYVLPTNQRDAHMCIGNAVCPPVAEWVVGRLMEVG